MADTLTLSPAGSLPAAQSGAAAAAAAASSSSSSSASTYAVAGFQLDPILDDSDEGEDDDDGDEDEFLRLMQAQRQPEAPAAPPAPPPAPRDEPEQAAAATARDVPAPARLRAPSPQAAHAPAAAAASASTAAVASASQPLPARAKIEVEGDPDDDIVITDFKPARPNAQPPAAAAPTASSSAILKMEPHETRLDLIARGDVASRSQPRTAAQRFWAGISSVHDADQRIDPPSALDRLCSLLPNSELVTLAQLSISAYPAATAKIYQEIEINGPTHTSLSRTLNKRPGLAASCRTLRIWQDSAVTPADSPSQGNYHHRLDWHYVKEILRIVESRAEAEPAFQVYLGMSALPSLVGALRGPSAGSAEGCPRLTRNIRKLEVIEDSDWNKNMLRFTDGWRGLASLLKHLGGEEETIASVEEFNVLSAGDWKPRAEKPNRSPPFLWRAFGSDETYSFRWPALRRLALVVRDHKHFDLLDDLDLPNLESFAVDADTEYPEEHDWSVTSLDSFLENSPQLRSIGLRLMTDHEYGGTLFGSYHTNLQFVSFHGPEMFLHDFDAFVGRHSTSLISLDAGLLLTKLKTLSDLPFPALRLLDARNVAASENLVVPAHALAHVALDYEAIRPKCLRTARGRGNGPSVRPSGAGTNPGKPKRNADGSDINPNTISAGTKLLEAEIPAAFPIETLQALTSLELFVSPHALSELTMELSMTICSRNFPNLLELKLLGERPAHDTVPLFLKKTPFQQFLVGLSDALSLRAVTLENFCDYLPPPEFLGPLCPFGPALEFILVRTCGTNARAWRISRSVPESAGTRQIAGIGDSEGREYAVNRPVVDVEVIPVDDFHFATVSTTIPADAWKDLSFFPHWDDEERRRILKATKEAAMIGVVPGAETHPLTGPGSKGWKAEQAEGSGTRLSATQSPSPTKRAAGQRTAAARSNLVTQQMFAASQPAPRSTRATQRRQDLERVYATQQPRASSSRERLDDGCDEEADPSAAQPKIEREEAHDDDDEEGDSDEEEEKDGDGDRTMVAPQSQHTGGKQAPAGFLTPSRFALPPRTAPTPASAPAPAPAPAPASPASSFSASSFSRSTSRPASFQRPASSNGTAKGAHASHPTHGGKTLPLPLPLPQSQPVDAEAGPSRVRQRSSSNLAEQYSASQPAASSSSATSPQLLQPPTKKARRSVGTNGFVIPRPFSRTPSPPVRRAQAELDVIQEARRALMDSERRFRTGQRAASPVESSSSSASPPPSAQPPRTPARPTAAPTAAATSGPSAPRPSGASGFRPGLGKSLEVALKVVQDVVDLTSSPEPDDVPAAAAVSASAPATLSSTATGARALAAAAAAADEDDESDGFEML
ncbi:hypothetical protein OC844_003926 [Tilletia horrida]|nr:hypothetical protein OC844_003926 [Tilletia horrida]